MNWVKEQFLDRVNTFGSVYAMFAGKKHYRYIRGLISKESLKDKILIPAYGDQFYTDVELLPIERKSTTLKISIATRYDR